VPFFWRNIRKQPDEITFTDLEKFPLWQGCLGEEGKPSQDESTMRPWKSRGPVEYPDFYGMVASDFITPGGRRFVGTIEPKQRTVPVWDHSPCIWLAQPAREIVSDARLERYNPIIYDRSISFTLPLAAYCSDQEARALIVLVYRVLGVASGELFPLAIRPRHAIKDFPPELGLPGFLRLHEQPQHRTVLT
jgi:hypothetical protein